MLGTGHPTGICTSSTSYVNLRGDEAPFMVRPMALYSDDDVACTPAIVAGAVGSSGGNPAYVKFSSTTSADDSEIEITSDTEALYSDPGGLNISKEGDLVNIYLKAPTDGAIYLMAYTLWEGIDSP